jgi:hypothetical protein
MDSRHVVQEFQIGGTGRILLQAQTAMTPAIRPVVFTQ